MDGCAFPAESSAFALATLASRQRGRGQGTTPGGGQIGAVLLNPDWIKAGSTDFAVTHNHYSALRTYEDLLGLRFGGADGHGHLGFAATAADFGPDVFNAHPSFPW
jgi:hypothetical protein